MRKALQGVVQATFYTTVLLILVCTPQIICIAIGAPIHY